MKALSAYEIGNYESAIIDLETLKRKNPEQSLLLQSYNLMAEAYRQMEQHHKSDSCYEMILAIEPENLMIRNNYAYYLSIREENLPRARELSYLTVIREPENPTYLDTYGWILFKMKEIKEAKNFIEKAIRNGAYNNAEVLDHYGDVMFELDKCDEAIEAWDKVIELDNSYDIMEKWSRAKEGCQ
jgi:tetratricopeptide (TPR) repeat protein